MTFKQHINGTGIYPVLMGNERQVLEMARTILLRGFASAHDHGDLKDDEYNNPVTLFFDPANQIKTLLDCDKRKKEILFFDENQEEEEEEDKKRYIKYYYNDSTSIGPEEAYKVFPLDTTDEQIEKDFKVWSRERYNKRFVDKNFLLEYSNFDNEAAFSLAASAMQEWYDICVREWWEELPKSISKN